MKTEILYCEFRLNYSYHLHIFTNYLTILFIFIVVNFMFILCTFHSYIPLKISYLKVE